MMIAAADNDDAAAADAAASISIRYYVYQYCNSIPHTSTLPQVLASLTGFVWGVHSLTYSLTHTREHVRA